MLEINTRHKPKPIKYLEVSKYDFEFSKLLSKKQDIEKLIEENKCNTCYMKNEHFQLQTELRGLQIQYQEYKKSISEQNLKYFNEFKNRLIVLQKLDYIDKNHQITLKGLISNLII